MTRTPAAAALALAIASWSGCAGPDERTAAPPAAPPPAIEAPVHAPPPAPDRPIVLRDGGAGGAAQPVVPSLGWPPPRPSAQQVLPPQWFVGGAEPARTLGDVDRRLGRALDATGYTARSYYHVPGGFALATQLERIDENGVPVTGDGRWSASQSGAAFSLAGYLRALFASEPGYFRVVVFVVTDHPFAASAPAPDRSTAEAWVIGGANRLPADVRATRWTSNTACTALVYEFRKPPGGAALVAVPGRLTADRHLRAAGLARALGD